MVGLAMKTVITGARGVKARRSQVQGLLGLQNAAYVQEGLGNLLRVPTPLYF